MSWHVADLSWPAAGCLLIATKRTHDGSKIKSALYPKTGLPDTRHGQTAWRRRTSVPSSEIQDDDQSGFRFVPKLNSSLAGSAYRSTELVSAGVHPFGLDHGDSRRAHQIGDERLRRYRFLAVGRDPYGVDHFALHF